MDFGEVGGLRGEGRTPGIEAYSGKVTGSREGGTGDGAPGREADSGAGGGLRGGWQTLGREVDSGEGADSREGGGIPGGDRLRVSRV